MRCPNCGNENPPDYVFCDECGARLQGEEDGGIATATAMATQVSEGEGASALQSGPMPQGAASVHPHPTDPAMGGHDMGNMGEPAMDEQGQGSDGGNAGGAGMYDAHGSVAFHEEPATTQYGAESSMGDTQDGAVFPGAESGPMSEGMAGGVSGDMSGADMSGHTASSAGMYGGASSGDEQDAGIDMPVTEDTIQDVGQGGGQGSGDGGAASYGPSMSTSDEGLAQASLPGVIPVDEGDGQAQRDTGGLSSMTYTPGSEAEDGYAPAADMPTTGAANGTEAGAGADSGRAWGAEAHRLLQNAESALADLRAHLMSGAGGTAPAASSMSQASQPSSPPATPQPMSAGADIAAGTEAEAPTLEPAAEAGSLGATSEDYGASYGAASMDQAATSDAGGATSAATMDGTGMAAAPAMPGSTLSTNGASNGASENMMARLVIISTGAELPLPDQEEITVGREDPSSGIFPDVDLTPYGGEEGGVSRRHARMLHVNSDYFVEDLQSTNFTKLDGQRLPAHVRERLEDGARIDFGRVATIFRRS